MIVLTHSDIHNFLECRRLWFWNYVRDFQPPETRHGARNLGARVHKALENLYTGGIDPVAYFNALSAMDISWAETNGQPEWVLDTLYKDTVIGRALVEKYIEWRAESGIDHGLEVVSVEETIEAPILHGEVLLRGRLDIKFRREDSGFLVLNDFKTVGRLDNGTRARLEHSYQHHVYMAIESLAHPDDPMPTAVNTLLVKGRRPEFHRLNVPGTAMSTPNRLKKIEMICTEMIRAIEEHSDYPSPDQHCAWCVYRNPCLLADDNEESALEYLSVKFSTGGVHARYTESDD